MPTQSNTALFEPLENEEVRQVSGGKYRGAVFMYTVQPGETLTVLAHRFGTTVRVLCELNDITNAAQVQAGRTLMIPQR